MRSNVSLIKKIDLYNNNKPHGRKYIELAFKYKDK